MIALLNAALEKAKRTPMYREKLQKSRLTKIEEFEGLPFTTKQDLRQSYPYGNLGVAKEEVIEVHTSSGTSGTPTVSFFTHQDLEVSAKYIAKAWKNFGIKRGSTVQFMMSYGLFSGAALNSYAIQSLGALVVPAGIQPIEKQIAMIREFGVDTIAATPSYYLCIYNYLIENNIDPKSLGLKVGIAAGEAYGDDLKQKISELFGIRIFDHYGLCEVNTGIVYECAKCGGMAVLKDYVYAEVVDPDTGAPLPNGEYGELVLSSTMKDASPILRYRTGDCAALIERSSGCDTCKGSTILSRIRHRIDDTFFYKGLLINPYELRDFIILQSGDGRIDNIKIEVHEDVDGIVHKIQVKLALVVPVSNEEFLAIMERKLYDQTRVHISVEQVPDSYFEKKSLKIKLVEHVAQE